MAKARVTTNPMYTGGAGGYSFYVRGGEQVVRQRKNNSNYGESASRSYAQMIRRIRWGNLVNVYKAIKSWQAKAYDSKTIGQTDYNIFMQLNINQVTVASTKEMNDAGCGIFEAYQVSRGSLPPVYYELDATNHKYITGIVLSEAITNSTTVGELAADIIANNPMYQANDNIAIVFMKGWMDARVEWPYVTSVYTEITLDLSSQTLVKDIAKLGERLSKGSGNVLEVSYTEPGPMIAGSEVGVAVIHTRKSAGNLYVSSQSILMNSQYIIQQFSGEEWDNTCIQTYGLDTEVPLDPNFRPGVISQVTANGAIVSNAETLTGSQELRVYIGDGSADDIRLTFNGVEYTPLLSGDGYIGYILGDNGECKIFVNGRVYMSLNVAGIVVPSSLPSLLNMSQRPSNLSGSRNPVEEVTKCLNYPFVKLEDFPVFFLKVGSQALPFEDEDIDNYDAVNASFDFHLGSQDYETWIRLLVDDDSKPAYLTYKGFIIAVFNYSN